MSLPQILFLVPILLWAQGVVLHFSLSICLNFLHFSLSVIVLVESELKTTSIGLAIGRLKNQLWFPGEENEKTLYLRVIPCWGETRRIWWVCITEVEGQQFFSCSPYLWPKVSHCHNNSTLCHKSQNKLDQRLPYEGSLRFWWPKDWHLLKMLQSGITATTASANITFYLFGFSTSS